MVEKDVHVNANWHCWTASGTCPQSINTMSGIGGNLGLHAVATKFFPWPALQEEVDGVVFPAVWDWVITSPDVSSVASELKTILESIPEGLAMKLVL